MTRDGKEVAVLEVGKDREREDWVEHAKTLGFEPPEVSQHRCSRYEDVKLT